MEHSGSHLKELTDGGADVVIDCVGIDGKFTVLEMVETALKLQRDAISPVVTAAQEVRKGGTIMLVGVYGARNKMFPLGDLFARNITVKNGAIIIDWKLTETRPGA